MAPMHLCISGVKDWVEGPQGHEVYWLQEIILNSRYPADIKVVRNRENKHSYLVRQENGGSKLSAGVAINRGDLHSSCMDHTPFVVPTQGGRD